MGTIWPSSNQMEFDNNGARAPGAKAYFYTAGTSTPKAVYRDAAETTVWTQPVTADGNGRWPAVFVPFGSYKTTITTSGGAALGATIDNIPNPAPTDPGVGVSADAIFQTGDMIVAGANTTRSGFVRCNGRTIGSATSGGTERANADTSNLFTYLWNNYANGQAAVSGGRGASAAADFAANKTIALPDYRSAAITGFDDMGNAALGGYASAPVVSGSGILAGSILGAATHTLTTGQLPSHTHGINVSTAGAGAHTHTGTTTSDGAHAHGPGTGTHFLVATPSGGTATVSGGTDVALAVGTSSTGAHTHTFASTSDPGNHTHTIAGTSDAAGSGTAHNLMQRSNPVTVLMKL